MRLIWLTGLSLLATSGCKVVDAPDNLEEIVVYGFVNFDQANDEYLRDTAREMIPLVEENLEDLADGVRVDELTGEDLGAAEVEADDVSGIVGAMGAVDYHNDIDEVIDVLIHHDKSDLFDNYLEYEVVNAENEDCFLAIDCQRMEQEVEETSKVVLLGEAFREFEQQLRWVETDDYGTVLFIRSLSPEPIEFSSNLANVFQQYAFVMLYEPEGQSGAKRVESFWVDAEIIGLDVPDSYAVDNAVKQMGKQAENIDTVIDEGL